MTVKIVVAGDVSVDWYYWQKPSYSGKEDVNWKLYEGIDTNPQLGGATLLAEWLRDILQIGTEESPYFLKSQSCEELIRKSISEVLHTNVYLGLFPKFISYDLKENVRIYRVKNYLGHIVSANKRQYPVSLEVVDDDVDADIVIIYDAGGGFRSDEKVWPKALKGDKKPIVIYNMYPPLFTGDLWNHILKHHKEKLVLILNADDLRKTGTNISRSVSWEKSAIEFLWEINSKEDLAEIKELNNIITRFKYEGAIHYRGKTERSKLYFDPVSLEGEFWNSKKFGDMRATNLVFVANLSACLISKFNEKKSSYQKTRNDSQNDNSYQVFTESAIEEGIKEGLKAGLIRSRESLIYGYGDSSEEPDFLKYSCLDTTRNKSASCPDHDNLSGNETFPDKAFKNDEPEWDRSFRNKFSKSPAGYIADTLLPPIGEIGEYSSLEQTDSRFWTILKEKTKEESGKIKNGPYKVKEERGKTIEELNEKRIKEFNEISYEMDSTYLEKLAFIIVKKGLPSIRDFPVGKFGKLVTVDRAEIESFRSIKNVMEEYIHSEKNLKPLSIAVFGSPGSGKSFGITQVAESIGSERIEKVVFNISQFTSTKDLTNAFHRVRDISLKGKIPLVFFDEFDSKLENEELGWIKYFLVPMQDGEFLDSETMHPIGKSIFVFAGSTYNRLKGFYEFCSYSNVQSKSYPGVDPRRKISNKCPDFMSRLRGYVNILGLNQANEKDETYIIRRAIQLRSLIEENAPNVIRENNAHVSCGILNALINVPEYMHGVRSMQAIVEMSILHEKNSWETAYLPPKDQLELHIKSIDEFYRLLAQKNKPCTDIK